MVLQFLGSVIGIIQQQLLQQIAIKNLDNKNPIQVRFAMNLLNLFGFYSPPLAA